MTIIWTQKAYLMIVITVTLKKYLGHIGVSEE